ncbi:MAG: SDR family oxidoreductase [Planctomycetes bacterium]|nr:SDR family oxidoreductase [Planctomycetota bacterium]
MFLVVGCGYLGRRVAERWLSAGQDVYTVTRRANAADELRAAGFHPIVADVLRPDDWRDLPPVRTVLFAVGHDRQSVHDIREVYVEGLRNVLTALPDSVERVIYISSTGVYGDTVEAVVDERTPCQPRRPGAVASFEAEELLRASRWRDRAIILRLAGIYGPGRMPVSKLLMRGEPIPAAPDDRQNLIHVDDAATVVVAAAERVPLPSLYNVADGQPVVRREFYSYLANILGTPPPTFDPSAAQNDATRRSGDKQVSNAKLLTELGVTLRYPSYREGLAAIFPPGSTRPEP